MREKEDDCGYLPRLPPSSETRKALARAENLADILADAHGDYCEDNPDPDHHPEPWVERAQQELGEERCSAIYTQRTAAAARGEGE